MRNYLYNFQSKIDCLENMLAHLSETNSEENETLLEHSNLVMDKVFMFDKHNNFLSKVKTLINDIVKSVDLFIDNKLISEFIFKLFLNSIYLHDAGKCSIAFQYKVMKNNFFKSDYADDMSENHSPFSSRIFMDFACEELLCLADNPALFKDDKGIIFLSNMILNFSYCIQKHHSSLSSIESFKSSLTSLLMYEDEDDDKLVFRKADCCPELKYYNNKANASKMMLRFRNNAYNIDSIFSSVSREILLLNKILYSALVTADSVATSEYMTNTKIELKNLNIDEVMLSYRDSKLYKGIQEHLKNNIFEGTINSVRCEIFKEADNNLEKNIDKNIFYLESPTGSGKTNTSMNIAFRTVELTKERLCPIQRIIYTAPFNSITTQTTEFLNNLFKDKGAIDIAEINSNNAIKTNNHNGSCDYELSLLDYQMMNYPITLTSHVKLFSILFGNSRLENHSLIHLFNSVIIIDEIQAYNINVWDKMISLLDVYAKYMNIKFVIMSATLPKISSLIKEGNIRSNYAELIDDSSKYFENKFFKERVSKYNFDMLSEDMLSLKSTMSTEDYKNLCFDKILSRIRDIYAKNKDSKILVEFIKKKTCREFYMYLKESNNLNYIKDESLLIKEITSDDNSYFKKKTIEEVSKNDSIIIISTQCIEAGVDINMDYGFKDISYIDNEEQFLGRIRREYDASKYSEAIFFDLDDADSVYFRDTFNYKKGLNVLNDNYRNALETKKFSIMFNDLLVNMNSALDGLNDKVTRLKFESLVTKLNYKEMYDALELIKFKNEYTLFIPFNITVEVDEAGKKIIKEYNGKEEWLKFKDAVSEKNYAKRKILLSEAACNMSYFTYKYLDVKGKEHFEYYLNSKGIDFESLNNIYYLNLDDDLISKFIDDEYKFNKDAFDLYSGDLFV